MLFSEYQNQVKKTIQDYFGEITDVVAIKTHSDKIEIKLYHLKFVFGWNGQ